MLEGTIYRELHVYRQYNDDWLLVNKLDLTKWLFILRFINIRGNDGLGNVYINILSLQKNNAYIMFDISLLEKIIIDNS